MVTKDLPVTAYHFIIAFLIANNYNPQVCIMLPIAIGANRCKKTTINLSYALIRIEINKWLFVATLACLSMNDVKINQRYDTTD